MKRLLAILMSTAICMSFAACSEKEASESSKSADSSSAVEESSEQQSQEASDLADEEKTIDDFINENKETFDVLKDAVDGTGMALDIVSRDNSLVYSYKFTTDTPTEKEQLEQGLENQRESFNQVLKSLQSIIPSTESIVVEYLDKEGNVITSYEFA